MISRIACLALIVTVACARSVPIASSGPTNASPARSSICAGYEDIIGLPDRPLTPCETDTMLRPARDLRFPWPASYLGPCQFVQVQVVVDSLGHLEPGSPSLLNTNVPGLASNVLSEMRNAQYLPAQRGGAPVRQVRKFHFQSPGADRCGS